MKTVHTSVMLEEVLAYLAPTGEESLFLDCTLGEGGHTEAFLTRFPHLRALGLDADGDILSRARRRLSPFGDRFQGINGWFDQVLRSFPLTERPDRILLDLGISTYHYSRSGRGFSFRADEPLDMRLSTDAGESAAEILARREEKELARIFFEFGEERYSRRIARAVVLRRKKKPIRTARDLAGLIWNAVPEGYRRGRIHPATRSFQALRIAVNRELERLEAALPAALELLPPGGRLGVIAFHSLEDRRVKVFFREKSGGCSCPPEIPVCVCGAHKEVEILTRRAVKPGRRECEANPPSRSARFRVVEKV